jgi:hypothetical protein
MSYVTLARAKTQINQRIFQPNLSIAEAYHPQLNLVQRLLHHGFFDRLSPINALQNHNYQRAMAAYRPQPLLMDNVSLLQRIQQDGIVVTHLDDLNLDRTVLSTAQDLMPQLAARSSYAGELRHIASNRQLPASLFLWGLQSLLLNLIESYLQLPVAYHGLYLRRDLRGPMENMSRSWQMDRKDHRMFEVILYLNNVDRTTGPFQYLTSEDSRRVCQGLNYRQGVLRADDVESIVGMEQWCSCLGRAGTLVLVDRARVIHRDVSPTMGDRYTLAFEYTSRSPRYPQACRSSLDPIALLEMADRLRPEQVPSVFWRH